MSVKPVIIFVGGFSNAGKTTALDYLKTHNFYVYSPSVILHQLSDRVCSYLLGQEPIKDREEKRKLNITLAEDILIPVCGRDLFPTIVINRVLDDIYQRDRKLIVIETIGGEEYSIMLDILDGHYGEFDIYSWNIRRVEERPGVDIRKLIKDATNVWNDSSLSDFHYQLDIHLERIFGL